MIKKDTKLFGNSKPKYYKYFAFTENQVFPTTNRTNNLS